MKEFLYESEGDNGEIPRFRKKSKWTPPCNRDLALETYIKAVKDDIHRAHPSCTRPWSPKSSTRNLSSRERKALLSLRTRTDITIKPEDKGSATVLMSRRDCFVKVTSHLENENFIEGWMKIPQNDLPRR